MLLLILLFSFVSGAAALIYEVVWFQLLEQVIGSTALSLAVLFATFMGGMCLGSLLLPRVVQRQRNPLRVYAAIELAIACCGIAVLAVLPIFSRALAATCLLLPTLLMGATLPALARQTEDQWLGILYGANIAGGVAGSLLTGFYLLRVYDTATATYVAVAANVAVTGTALVFSAYGSHKVAAEPNLMEPRPPASRAVYLVIALSGFTALAAEVIWTRTLGLLFGASVYTLSIILAVFLSGLGIGSALGSLLSRTIPSSKAALGWCQLLLPGAIAWSAYTMNASLPYWPINPLISSDIRFNFELDLARAFWTLLPPTLLWGASFPFALAAAAPKMKDRGRLMSAVYAANTLGAIVGALLASLLLIEWVGSQRAQQLLVAVSAFSGLLVFIPAGRTSFSLSRGKLKLALLAVPGILCIRVIPPVPKLLIAYGRYAATWVGKADVVYAREGMNSAIAVSSFPNGVVTFHVAGKIQASNVPRDMRLQRMLGHLTTLPVAHPRSVLVIGCGAGITAGAVAIDPEVRQVTIAEIERLVPQAASAYFARPNFDVLHNSKVQVRIDDGRHYLLASGERFDGITVDPLDPWVKGAANLYTAEFLEAMKQHLNPGGTVTLYIQLFETIPAAVKSAVATFFEVFPNGTIWGNPYEGRGHDMILLGTGEPLRIDLDRMEKRFGYRDPDSKIPQSLAEVGISSPVDLFASYAGRKSDLTEWLQSAAINRDRNLRMEYLAGLGLNADDSAEIYASMLKYRRFPEDIFSSSEGRLDSLRRARK
ncbi:MAG: fused MFS/spermidine synthase [Bryobacterales bacterium]|nr:fused MFS/spermidine synthase [Bryobacterales bacterium]